MRSILFAGVTAAFLLAGCDKADAPANDATAVDTGNAAVVVPAGNAIVDAVAANASEAAVPAVNLAPDELTLVLASGSTRHVSFGTTKADAVRMIAAALGDPIEQGASEECGAGPLDFANFREGLSLYFQEGKFAGWDLDGREGGKFTTANGIGIGSTRKALDAAGPVTVEESSIGHEFMLGEMSGLLDSAGPEGKITNLWAGVNCIAR